MQETLDLWDWRRLVAALYASVRAAASPRTGWAHWVETRQQLFRSHPQSPLEADARASSGVPHCFAYDPTLRFTPALVPAAPRRLELPAGADGSVVLEAFARTEGLATPLGGELTLFWIGGYGGGVFLPFADATSGRESFGAGRYLLDTVKGADLGRDPAGRVILDFNFAYAPSCAYSNRYVCPLAPPENRLPAAVRAGERATQQRD